VPVPVPVPPDEPLAAGQADRKVLLAALPPGEAERVLVEPSRSGITPRWQPDAEERAAALREVRARGWALTDQELAPGIRSVAAPLRDGDGRTIAALNVTVHAAETPVEVLTGEYLPWLLQTAGAISADWAACQGVSQVTITRAAAPSGRAAVVGLTGIGPARAGLDTAASPVPVAAEEPARHLVRWRFFSHCPDSGSWPLAAQLPNLSDRGPTGGQGASSRVALLHHSGHDRLAREPSIHLLYE